MITDKFNLFTDNVPVRANANSTTVSLMPFAGNNEPVNVTVIATEAYPAGAGLSVTVQESADNTTFSDVATYKFADLLKPEEVLSFSLPQELKKKYVRLAYVVTGSPATGKLWAGITRDHIAPYESGLYINKGKVVA